MSRRPGALGGPRFRRWSWLIIAALVLVAFVRAGVSDGPPRTAEEQVRQITSTLKCPTCRSQAVSGSDSAAARAIRTEVARRVSQGESADEIRDAIASTYGDDVLLTPGRSGLPGLVWVLPVVVLVIALAGISAAFARWRRMPLSAASEADRALVEEALGNDRP
jgi:cytochrome c-type biogenesis protein CcmH/NrfF